MSQIRDHNQRIRPLLSTFLHPGERGRFLNRYPEMNFQFNHQVSTFVSAKLRPAIIDLHSISVESVAIFTEFKPGSFIDLLSVFIHMVVSLYEYSRTKRLCYLLAFLHSIAVPNGNAPL